jgi:hypothetical protein
MSHLTPTPALKLRMWDPGLKRMIYEQGQIFRALANIHTDGLAAAMFMEMVFMLFSSAHDRDKQEIYDGDLLEGYASSEELIRFQVLIRDYKFVTVDEDGCQIDLCDCDLSRFSVIGNVFQNPDWAIIENEVV